MGLKRGFPSLKYPPQFDSYCVHNFLLNPCKITEHFFLGVGPPLTLAPPPHARTIPPAALPSTSTGNTPYSDVTGLKTVKKDGKVKRKPINLLFLSVMWNFSIDIESSLQGCCHTSPLWSYKFYIIIARTSIIKMNLTSSKQL